MIFIAIKALLSGAWSIFAKHWRVILPILILAYCLYKYNDAVSDKVRAQQEYAAHLQADKDALIKRDAELKLNAILAQKKTDALVISHQNEIADIKSKGKSNEAKLKANDVVTTRALNNYRDGLRLAIEREAALRLSRDDSNRLAGTSSDTAISRPVQEAEAELEVCKEAGAVCAADYNFCYAYVKSEQSIIGVRP